MTLSARLKSAGIRLKRNPGYLVIAALITAAIASPFLSADRGPSYTRAFLPVEEPPSLVWQRRIPWAAAYPALDAHGIYYYDSERQSLAALRVTDGEPLWENSSSPVIYGVGSILVDGTMVYIATATHVAAFSAATGNLVWSTELGYGHVSVQPSLGHPSLLRVYYGESMFDLSRETGEITSKSPLDDVLWIAGDVAVRTQPPGIAANTFSTLTPLWRSYVVPFGVDERFPPLDLFPHLLVFIFNPQAICDLDLRDGHYRWCTSLSFSSNMIAGPSGTDAFVLDDELNLIAVALGTGKSRTVASFPAPASVSLDPHRGYNYGLSMYADMALIYLGDTNQVFLMKTDDK